MTLVASIPANLDLRFRAGILGGTRDTSGKLAPDVVFDAVGNLYTKALYPARIRQGAMDADAPGKREEVGQHPFVAAESIEAEKDKDPREEGPGYGEDDGVHRPVWSLKNAACASGGAIGATAEGFGYGSAR